MRPTLARAIAASVQPVETVTSARRIAALCAVVLFVVVGGVLGVFWWWMSYSSPRSQAIRYLQDEVRAGRGCLLSHEWAHVDPASGLVVAKIARAINCRGQPAVWQSPCLMGDRDASIEAWNDALEVHLQAGEPCGPHFLDRVVDVDTIRARFRQDAPRSIALPGDEIVTVGDHDVRWWDSSVIVREHGAPKWLQPAGGAPVEPDLDRSSIDVTALTADAGRTLWVRVASKANEDLWYFVVDLTTGTNFEVFDATAR